MTENYKNWDFQLDVKNDLFSFSNFRKCQINKSRHFPRIDCILETNINAMAWYTRIFQEFLRTGLLNEVIVALLHENLQHSLERNVALGILNVVVKLS